MIELKDFVASIEREHDYAYVINTSPDEIRVLYELPTMKSPRCAVFVPDNGKAYFVEIFKYSMTVDEYVKYNMFGADSILYYSNFIKESYRRLNDEKEKEN